MKLLAFVPIIAALAPRAGPRKIRGVREDRWSFDILTKWKKEGEHAEIVATDARGEVGWFEVLRSRGSNALHARRKGVATALFSRAEEIVRDWDLNELLLTCVKHHEPSYGLYRKLGFDEVEADLAADSDSVMMRKFVPTTTRTE